MMKQDDVSEVKIHALFADLAIKAWREYGIRVDGVAYTWIDTRIGSKPENILLHTKMETRF